MLFSNLLLMSSCYGTTASTETAESVTMPWYVLIIYLYLLTFIGIPFFVTGLIKSIRLARRLQREDGLVLRSLRIKLIVFFALTWIPVANIVFFILMLATRSKIIRMSNENSIIDIATEVVKKQGTDFETQANELERFKSLLDSGAITREEYEKKKKQILES